ncbi:MAG TPA: LysR family transcriptional regulator [Burkholderiaceae bacterium]|nr:LysR family transcriptional regulator [Burkholderiaceae bacterium]
MTLEQLRILVKVVEAGSFTRAAELLGTQKSHASRVVAQLERQLGAKLLERTTRSLSVTETGREVHERAVGILAAVEDTERLVAHAQSEPRGLLRLTCGVEFGMLAVGAWIDAFLAAHPEVTVEAEYTSRVLDLVHEGFDLAIRIGPLPPSRLVARPLGALEYGLFASPDYLARHGAPRRPEALATHRLAMFTGGGLRRGWTLGRGEGAQARSVKVDGPARLRVNNAYAIRDALLGGLGIGLLPLLLAREPLEAGRLVPVLADWVPEPVAVNAVYPSNRYLSPKVRAFVDLAARMFPEQGAGARRARGAAPLRIGSRARPRPSPPSPVRRARPE